MELSINELLSTIVAALTACGATWVSLRRRYSHDSKAIEGDKHEVALMATLRAERDMAMQLREEAQASRLADRETIARQQGQLEANERELSRLRDEIFAMRLQLRKISSILVKLDPATAALLELGFDTDGLENHTSRPAPLR